MSSLSKDENTTTTILLRQYEPTKRLHPTWEKLEEEIDSLGMLVGIANMDCQAQSNLCHEQQLMAFPTHCWYEAKNPFYWITEIRGIAGWGATGRQKYSLASVVFGLTTLASILDCFFCYPWQGTEGHWILGTWGMVWAEAQHPRRCKEWGQGYGHQIIRTALLLQQWNSWERLGWRENSQLMLWSFLDWWLQNGKSSCWNFWIYFWSYHLIMCGRKMTSMNHSPLLSFFHFFLSNLGN